MVKCLLAGLILGGLVGLLFSRLDLTFPPVMTDSHDSREVHPCSVSSCRVTFAEWDNHVQCFVHRSCPATSSLSSNKSITCVYCRSWDQDKWTLFEVAKTKREQVQAHRMSHSEKKAKKDGKEQKSATTSRPSSALSSAKLKSVQSSKNLPGTPTSPNDRGSIQSSNVTDPSLLNTDEVFGTSFRNNGLDSHVMTQSFQSQPTSAQGDPRVKKGTESTNPEISTSQTSCPVVADPEQSLLKQLLESFNEMKSSVSSVQKSFSTLESNVDAKFKRLETLPIQMPDPLELQPLDAFYAQENQYHTEKEHVEMPTDESPSADLDKVLPPTEESQVITVTTAPTLPVDENFPYSNEQYNNFQYRNTQYEKEQYGKEPYGKEPFPYGKDGKEPYGKEPYGKEPYGKEQYGKEPFGFQKFPYGKESYGKESYGKESYGKEQYGKEPYGYHSVVQLQQPTINVHQAQPTMAIQAPLSVQIPVRTESTQNRTDPIVDGPFQGTLFTIDETLTFYPKVRRRDILRLEDLEEDDDVPDLVRQDNLVVDMTDCSSESRRIYLKQAFKSTVQEPLPDRVPQINLQNSMRCMPQLIPRPSRPRSRSPKRSSEKKRDASPPGHQTKKPKLHSRSRSRSRSRSPPYQMSDYESDKDYPDHIDSKEVRPNASDAGKIKLAVRVLTETLPDIRLTNPAKKSSKSSQRHVPRDVAAAEAREALGKTALPPHPQMLGWLNATDKQLKSINKAKGTPFVSIDIRRAGKLYPASEDAAFMAEPREHPPRFEKVSSLKNTDQVKKLRKAPVHLSPGISRNIETSTRVALSASSYNNHFIAGARSLLNVIMADVEDIVTKSKSNRPNREILDQVQEDKTTVSNKLMEYSWKRERWQHKTLWAP